MSDVIDQLYIGYGWTPYFAHAEFEWSGSFDTRAEAVSQLTEALKASKKQGELYWCIRHPEKPWESGHYPHTTPTTTGEG